jgi:hypothetical protein
MKIRLITLFISLSLGACVQAPVFKQGNYASIKSNYPIVNVNGVDVEPLYSLDIDAGENTFIIIYNSYQYDYHCTFTWEAVAQTAYEVTDQENNEPLILYRWVRKNGLWAIRMDPVHASQCIREER